MPAILSNIYDQKNIPILLLIIFKKWDLLNSEDLEVGIIIPSKGQQQKQKQNKNNNNKICNHDTEVFDVFSLISTLHRKKIMCRHFYSNNLNLLNTCHVCPALKHLQKKVSFFMNKLWTNEKIIFLFEINTKYVYTHTGWVTVDATVHYG